MKGEEREKLKIGSVIDLRDHYLMAWEKYPVVEVNQCQQWIAQELYCGRVLSIEDSQWIFLSDGKNFRFSNDLGNCRVLVEVSKIWKSPPQFVSFSQLLRPGDWLEVTLSQYRPEPQSLRMLAPNTRLDYPVAKTSGLAIRFAEFLDQLRQHFLQSGFREVSTPTLVACPGLEPHLLPFSTIWSQGDQGQKYYLPTSPEIHLKKLLCRGYERIFEIKKVFRDDLKSPLHRPEFHMLEWYMAFASLADLQKVLQSCLQKYLPQLQSWRELSVADLFDQHYGFELTPGTGENELRGLCHDSGIEECEGDSFDDLFQRLWISRIESWLEKQPGALVLRWFPPQQAALARLTPSGWADRFELYLGGKEVANAYQELNDAAEQRRRFEQFQTERGDDVPIDEEFLRHLESGMPPSAGIAVGLERLFMSIYGIEKIEDLFEFHF